MAIREGRWDCPSCGSVRIYGRHVNCPSCASPRPAGVRFYLTDDAPVLNDPERLAEAAAGPDWICHVCGATNRATVKTCGGCSAPRGASATQRVADYAPGEAPRSGDAPSRGDEHKTSPCDHKTPLGGDRKTPPGGRLRGLAKGPPAEGSDVPWKTIAVATVALVIGAGAWMARPKPADEPIAALVVSRSWQRQIILERVDTVEEGSWERKDYPAPIRVEQRLHHQAQVITGYDTLRTRQLVSHQVEDGYDLVEEKESERVEDGTETYDCGQRDLGNGYFETRTCTRPSYTYRTTTRTVRRPRYRTVSAYETVEELRPIRGTKPVYAPWYIYPAERATAVDTFEATGTTPPWRWPGITRDTTGLRVRYSDSNTLVLRTGDPYYGGDVMEDVDSAQWERFRPGTRVAWRPYQAILPADSLRACRRWHAGKGDPPPRELGCSPRRARR